MTSNNTNLPIPSNSVDHDVSIHTLRSKARCPKCRGYCSQGTIVSWDDSDVETIIPIRSCNNCGHITAARKRAKAA